MAFRFVPRLINQAAVRPPVQLEGLAGKYASAAYVSALTRGEKSLLKVESDLKAFNELLRGNSQTSSELRTYLTNPTISAEDRIKTVDMILAQQKGNEDEITRNLFVTLAQNSRLNLTEKVVEGFLELMSAFRGEATVIITSAKPLDKSSTSRLESILKSSQFASSGNKTVKFAYKVNPSVEGGIVVDLGERSVDLSVRSRVAKLNSLLRESI